MTTGVVNLTNKDSRKHKKVLKNLMVNKLEIYNKKKCNNKIQC